MEMWDLLAPILFGLGAILTWMSLSRGERPRRRPRAIASQRYRIRGGDVVRVEYVGAPGNADLVQFVDAEDKGHTEQMDDFLAAAVLLEDPPSGERGALSLVQGEHHDP